MTTKILGPSTIVQAAAIEIIQKVPDSFYQRNIAVFEVRRPAVGKKTVAMTTSMLWFALCRRMQG